MSPEIIAFAIVFAVGVLAGIQFEKATAKERRADWRRRNAWRWKKKGEAKSGPSTPKLDAAPDKAPDAADQLRTVMRADFKAQPLLNKKEALVFSALDKMVLAMKPGWQVMAQVSLGEVLSCEDRDAYWCINAKRVDFLIVDSDCRPVGAIEYQGGAHFKGAHATAARDAVKKEALRRAGIGYVEVVAGDPPAELRRVVERLVQKASA
jgi:hypothetical protein